MYCTKCGKKLTELDSEGYNHETGKKNTKLVCPTGICEHTGVDHEYKFRKWYQKGHEYCVKCNKLFWHDYGL